jgi:hypothetical protein
MGQDMKYEKETTGPKNPNVVVKKSALEEFLAEWGFWREKKKATKQMKIDAEIEELHNMPTAERIKRKRKQQTKFMDSGFMLVIKIIAGLIDFIVSVVMWIFSFMFSFKGIAIIGALFYYFGDIDVTKIIEGQVKEQAIELKEEVKADLNELKKEHGAKVKEEASVLFDSFKNTLEGFADSIEGLEINIKKSDGTVINIGGDKEAEVPNE